MTLEFWQHFGNRSSGSSYSMDNPDNGNSGSQIAHTKSVKSRFAGESGSEIRKPENPVKSRLPGFTKFPLITV